MTHKSNRRDFLRGRAAQDALADAVGGALPKSDPEGAPDRPDDDAHVLRVSRQAMACEFEVRLGAGQYESGIPRALEALDLVDATEDQLSVFRETSELARINRLAADEAVEVSPPLFALLELAARLNRETDGALDITSAPLWEVWGFARREVSVPDDQQIAEALACVGGELVEMDAAGRTVHFRRRGVRLNLGSIGKGYALDRCAEKLLADGIEDFLLHGGNSSVLARGSRESQHDRPSGLPAHGWTVGVRHPLRPERRLAEIELRDRALATSGSWAQSFVHQGRRLSHVLDPRTGWPAERALSVTAVAPTAAVADGLATAFFVMGPDAALAYCADRPELGVVLVCPRRRRGGIEVRSAGLADDELRLL